MTKRSVTSQTVFRWQTFVRGIVDDWDRFLDRNGIRERRGVDRTIYGSGSYPYYETKVYMGILSVPHRPRDQWRAIISDDLKLDLISRLGPEFSDDRDPALVDKFMESKLHLFCEAFLELDSDLDRVREMLAESRDTK